MAAENLRMEVIVGISEKEAAPFVAASTVERQAAQDGGGQARLRDRDNRVATAIAISETMLTKRPVSE
eukprot:5541761-Lingulodinium_polyedra.AAC.1